MATIHRHCDRHPDRQAIGVCVVTRKAICAECSTRYEGVNYSKEGLELVQARRAALAGRRGTGERLALAAAVVLSPVMVLGLYVFLRVVLALLIDLNQVEAA